MFVALTLVDSSHAQMLSCKLIVIASGPLGRPLLSVTNPCRERNQSLGW
jgi:hypothetical protein